ncbi:hypothetical protein E2C01_005425 [Portunus trituberculatus]|uniref:Uncharacterized protein n=1 Tax=Portunus trituberculatus TaxID=210409 RepID=A0A5B7CTG7_PORTR|nr:hypothetical protein [Portunus trituberculatus]
MLRVHSPQPPPRLAVRESDATDTHSAESSPWSWLARHPRFPDDGAESHHGLQAWVGQGRGPVFVSGERLAPHSTPTMPSPTRRPRHQAGSGKDGGDFTQYMLYVQLPSITHHHHHHQEKEVAAAPASADCLMAKCKRAWTHVGINFSYR